MKTFATAGLAAATLLLAACGGGADTADTNAANVAEENLSFEPANDQSALDMVANEGTAEPLPENLTSDTDTTAPVDDAPLEGNDQVESNVAGM